ncbi:MAG: hypothetical protein Q8920_05055 [Bacillota bacterium]|nr:hypothetical protein [Bacillota bacterium]
MQTVKDNQIERILLEAGLIKDNFDLKLEEGCEKIPDPRETEDHKDILRYKAADMGVEFADLENIAVNKDAVGRVSAEVVQKYYVFPFDMKNNYLMLAMENPEDLFIIDEIKMYIQMEIKPFLAESRLIGKAIEYFYGIIFASPQAEVSPENTDLQSREAEKPIEQENTGKDVDLDEVVNLLANKYSLDSNIEKITNVNIDTVNKKVGFTLTFEY